MSNNFKKNLVYIHGFSANKDDHPLLLNKLKSENYQFYNFDLPAHGSLKDKYNIDEVKFDMLVKYCVEKIKSFNLDSFILFGHSMGGAISTTIAGEKHFEKEMTGLILEAPLNKKTVTRSVSSYREALNNIKHITKKNKLSEAIKDYFTSVKDSKKDYMSLLFNILSRSSLLRIQDAITNIDVPTLLLTADCDVYIPCKDTAVNYSNYIDDLETHIIKGSGHCISIDQPKEFYKYFIGFLHYLEKRNG